MPTLFEILGLRLLADKLYKIAGEKKWLTFTIFFIGKTPCMENIYLLIGNQIFNNNVETLNLTPFYSIIILDWSHSIN